MTKTKHVWTVKYNYGKGKIYNIQYSSRNRAQDAIKYTAFDNEECISFHMYKQEVQVEIDPTEFLNRMRTRTRMLKY